MRLTLPLLLLATACAQRAPAPPLSPPPRTPPAPPLQEGPRRRSTGPLTQVERDSLLREVAARREAWRARQISDYRIEIAVGCFCPWPSHPAILDVRGGVIVALQDTMGKSIGKPREPWSLYTVEGLFDAVERGARRSDVIQVAYDEEYHYPAMIRGDAKVGQVDDWFWVTASRLTPSR